MINPEHPPVDAPEFYSGVRDSTSKKFLIIL